MHPWHILGNWGDMSGLFINIMHSKCSRTKIFTVWGVSGREPNLAVTVVDSLSNTGIREQFVDLGFVWKSDQNPRLDRR
jgi:hypothetical protein